MNKQNKTILVIDDDKKLLDLIDQYLSSFAYTVYTAEKPSEGLKILQTQSINLIILDLMLPEINGLNLCEQIRQTMDTPIIMLSAKGESIDKIIGLEKGADDYLSKPFEPRELIARIEAISRRVEQKNNIPNTESNHKENIIKIENLTVDKNKYAVYIGEQNLNFTIAEFNILLILVGNIGKVVSRDYFIQNLKGREYDVFDRSIDIMISRIRKKINDKNNQIIKSIRGQGYQMIENV